VSVIGQSFKKMFHDFTKMAWASQCSTVLLPAKPAIHHSV
jgi:hypothetical protein